MKVREGINDQAAWRRGRFLNRQTRANVYSVLAIKKAVHTESELKKREAEAIAAGDENARYHAEVSMYFTKGVSFIPARSASVDTFRYTTVEELLEKTYGVCLVSPCFFLFSPRPTFLIPFFTLHGVLVLLLLPIPPSLLLFFFCFIFFSSFSFSF